MLQLGLQSQSNRGAAVSQGGPTQSAAFQGRAGGLQVPSADAVQRGKVLSAVEAASWRTPSPTLWRRLLHIHRSSASCMQSEAMAAAPEHALQSPNSRERLCGGGTPVPMLLMRYTEHFTVRRSGSHRSSRAPSDASHRGSALFHTTSALAGAPHLGNDLSQATPQELAGAHQD